MIRPYLLNLIPIPIIITVSPMKKEKHFFAGIGVKLLIAAAVSGVLAAAAVLVPGWNVLLLVGFWVWFVMPGVAALRRLYRDTPGGAGIAWLFGAPLGYAVSSLLLLAAWLLGLRTVWLLIVCPFAALLLTRLLPSLGTGLRVPRLTGRDAAAAALMVFLALGVVAQPFSRVGADLPEGRAYRAYFTADFVWEMAVTAEVSKGGTIPANPFLYGKPMNYYWLYHLFPASEYRAFDRYTRLDRLLTVNNLLTGVMFMLFLYGVARHFTSSAAAAGVGCLFGVLLTSAEGLYLVMRLFIRGRPLAALRNLNIDAISRWIFGSLPVDGLQRALLYQPQHQMGYALAFLALIVVIQQWRRPVVSASALAGFLLACGLLVSSFSALMLTIMTGIAAGICILKSRNWRTGILSAAAGAVPIILAVILSYLLHYVKAGESLIILGPNPLAFNNPLIGLPLSFGPIAAAALPGAWLLVKRAGAPRVTLFTVVMVISLLFFFFVDVRDHQGVYVGWRASHLIFIGLIGVVAIGFHHLVLRKQKPLSRRIAWASFFVICALAAAPTALIDLYNAQDIYNRHKTKRFPWTLILTRDEMAAFHWIRQVTPPDARVQVETDARTPATWAYIPAFAERRMAAGIPISMVPLAPYYSASYKVKEIYRSTDPTFISKQVKKLAIDYLVLGPVEQKEYPLLENVLDGRPRSFRKVFKNPSVIIYAVSKRVRSYEQRMKLKRNSS
jgi:hypothetical protein